VLLGARAPAAAMPSAQSVRFDKVRHLEGYEAVYYSEWSDLYRLEEFDLLEGKEVSLERLEELRRRWEQEVARVRSLLEELEADPPRKQRFRLERALDKHPYFARVETQLVLGRAPFLFVVQAPPKPDSGYVQRLTSEYAALLAPLVERYEELLGAAGLEQRADHPLIPICVLPTVGDLRNYARATQSVGHFRAHSLYDTKLGAAVIYESPFTPARSPLRRRTEALHAVGHVLQQAWYTGGANAPVESWLLEGLAVDLADELAVVPGAAGTAGASGAIGPPAEELSLMARAAEDPAQRWANVRPVLELARVSNTVEIYGLLRSIALKDGRAEPDYDAATLAFLRQAALLVHYLRTGEEGGLRPVLVACLAAELTRKSTSAALVESLAPRTAEELDQGFLRWLVAEHRRALPNAAIDEAVVTGAALPNAAPKAGAAPEAKRGPPSAAAQPPGPPAVEPLDPAALAPAERFALALWEARRGRAREALATFAELDHESELAERAARERRRLEAWIALRDGWLERLAQEGGDLRLERDGERVRARVAGLADGVLQLEERRAGAWSVPVAELDPYELARQIDRGLAGEISAEWVRLYPYVLTGETQWKRLLDGDTPEARALVADGEDDYPERLRLAHALGALVDLSRLAPPSTSAEARARLARIEALRADYGDLPALAERGALLADCARQAWFGVAEHEGLGSMLRGSCETVEEGRVRITYEFSDPAELEDFRASSYLAEMHGAYPRLGTDAEGLSVSEGALRGVGRGCLRHVAGFAAPLRVSWDVTYEAPAGDSSVWFFNVGVCDDGERRFAWAVNIFHMEVWDGRVAQAGPSDSVQIYNGAKYHAELVHDGTKVELSSSDTSQAELPCERSSGGVFLWMHTDLPIVLDRLVIEAALDDAALAALRAAWVEERMAQF
jgi:hypothetical protein